MRVELELKNYRCFPVHRAARIEVGPGMAGFIGINNAGKSALIKFFYEARNLFGLLSSPSGNLLNAITTLADGARETVAFIGVTDQQEVFTNLNEAGMTLTFRMLDEPRNEDRPVPVPSVVTVTVERADNRMAVVLDGETLETGGWSWDGSALTRSSDRAYFDLQQWFDFFRSLADSLYLGPFRNAIQVGSGQHYDLQIGQAFVSQWDQYRSGGIKRENDAALRLIDEIRAIFGFERLDITATANNETLQVIADGKSYRLDEVGAGLAHFVMVLATAAVRQPGFVLIDEPELNLHPALQLSFLTAVGSYAREGVLFATHSLGLARAAGTPLYSVRRIASGDSEVRRLEETPDLAEFLGELGLSGYQELGYDRVLLVEGPTDVLVVQQFLRLLRADHRVVLLPLGGSAMITAGAGPQLQEVTRLTGNVSALIDSERSMADAEPAERINGFRETCDQLGITCHVLERRAIENYLSDRAVRAVKGDTYRALGSYEARSDAELVWAKTENWRIASAMSAAELEATDLGAFLAELIAEPAD